MPAVPSSLLEPLAVAQLDLGLDRPHLANSAVGRVGAQPRRPLVRIRGGADRTPQPSPLPDLSQASCGSDRGEATVHAERGALDVGGVITGQKDDDGCDLLGRAERA